ncbi:MAG TPA: hypothetical protein PKE64_29035 [Anaerolineae bacterium]|nr:hypothetical protein [Anaerolineae bacterium]HMR68076.1 hypothetical protein [Anaerolineae bacterium]
MNRADRIGHKQQDRHPIQQPAPLPSGQPGSQIAANTPQEREVENDKVTVKNREEINALPQDCREDNRSMSAIKGSGLSRWVKFSPRDARLLSGDLATGVYSAESAGTFCSAPLSLPAKRSGWWMRIGKHWVQTQAWLPLYLRLTRGTIISERSQFKH